MNDVKTAIITAAAGAGIGSAVARQLAADGMRVIITDLHEGRMAKLSEELSQTAGVECPWYALDVSDHDAVEKVFDDVAHRYGGIDVLVNNAGWSVIEPVSEMSLEAWRKCLDIDLTGTFSCMRFALPHMISANSGAIVNISSISGWEMTTEHGAAYSAAKAGVMALTRVAAAENGKHNIRVNAIAPGLIYNDFLRRIYPDTFFDSYLEKKAVLNRLGEPEDIAHMVSFLVSEKAGYITGETYGLSGGVHPHA
ncbi:SDR family NAD(P)-dependent oxidoreductase [Roseovarius pacificus]|uniref:SDR family NAD(P)-dependent oxidoreductase n=1 Tax=Roseovarius pacificus TaxID=337701 RepID=UPI002A187CEA|nr:SDR family NAD(P)-dependent oxidoreductase [Roseovarius pacificus]